jgi:hypothetical protein
LYVGQLRGLGKRWRGKGLDSELGLVLLVDGGHWRR